jgi:hypothetical protein
VLDVLLPIHNHDFTRGRPENRGAIKSRSIQNQKMWKSGKRAPSIALFLIS